MSVDFILPDLGEGISEAQVIKVLVNEGDNIEADQYLMEVETDKAAVEIPSPHTGVAKQIHVKEGQTVNVGEVIVTFDTGGASGNGEAPKAKKEEPKAAASAPAPSAPAAAPPPPPPGGAKKTTAPAAPVVRKMAREMGIDLDTVQGSGPGGRVTKADLENYQSGGGAAPASTGAPAAQPVIAAAPTQASISLAPAELPAGTDESDKWGEVRQVPFTQIRKTIAKQMAKSVYTVPHVTHIDECNITELERVRKNLNEATGNNPKMTVMTLLIRALCIALKKHPEFNSSFDEENNRTTYKKYINIGIAVDTERGLIVPVIRNTDQLSLTGIATELRAIAERVRTNQFAIEDLRGGTFTITNVGALGGMFSTPIINHPEVAILGLGRSKKVPVIDGDELTEATMLPLSLSFDHRATDGANAARFTGTVMSLLEDPARMLLF